MQALIIVVMAVIALVLVVNSMKKKEQLSLVDYNNPYQVTKWLNSNYPMPDWYSSTQRRCTDGCIYRPRSGGVYVDVNCPNVCINQHTNKGLNAYTRELIQSIKNGRKAFDS